MAGEESNHDAAAPGAVLSPERGNGAGNDGTGGVRFSLYLGHGHQVRDRAICLFGATLMAGYFDCAPAS